MYEQLGREYIATADWTLMHRISCDEEYQPINDKRWVAHNLFQERCEYLCGLEKMFEETGLEDDLLVPIRKEVRDLYFDYLGHEVDTFRIRVHYFERYFLDLKRRDYIRNIYESLIKEYCVLSRPNEPLDLKQEKFKFYWPKDHY